ncbi:hypothetical protein MPLA_2060010 [Mesorhizobium sp. ORS 3359]|uniref:Uncharacterized protein n=1 Tax=Mesorhizobium plurifarium TaxID=69974 RepID=A0A090GVK8_MESPL|nr:hypothetical protein MPLA_2060010 [Mesorhizobium sp. ORS 3359]CDX60438.1 hypothetical protein MPL3365_380003 [Mesorhizobium plurifarium]
MTRQGEEEGRPRAEYRSAIVAPQTVHFSHNPLLITSGSPERPDGRCITKHWLVGTNFACLSACLLRRLSDSAQLS